MMDPAFEVNEKGTREKNDGNEVVEEGRDEPKKEIQSFR